jgi:hypothetical protein
LKNIKKNNKIMKSLFTSLFLFLTMATAVAQNNIDITPKAAIVNGNLTVRDTMMVGNYITPIVPFDVLGTSLFHGNNYNYFNITPQSALELHIGRSSSGSLVQSQSNSDIAFNFGGVGAGYRHFISSRHSNLSNNNGNALDFYINNSFFPTDSKVNFSGVGIGNIAQMSITARGVGIGTKVPTRRLSVNGSAQILDSLNIGTTNGTAHFDLTGNANFRGRNTNTFITNTNPSAVNFYTGRNQSNSLNIDQLTGDISFQSGGNNGGFKHFLVTRHSGTAGNSPNNSFDFYVNNSNSNVSSLAPNNGNILAMSVTATGVGIGVDVNNLSATNKLEVVGHTKITGDITVTGKVNAGYSIVTNTIVQPANTTAQFTVNCPSGSVITGGGGGHADFNVAASDIKVVYSGPNPDLNTLEWRLITQNTSNQTRTIRVYCMCARLN